jgi:N-acetylglucosamine kinase-like BadF-type ATPase
MSVGLARATENLDKAIAAAFSDAGLAPARVDTAVLAMAGSDRDEIRRPVATWADERRLAGCFRLVSDAVPVLWAGTTEGWGVALISGTGSFAFGQSRDGRQARSGGWGRLLGDEGSGYAIALAGLRAATREADSRGPSTRLLPAILHRLRLDRPEQLITAVNRAALGADPLDVAALAEVVIATDADGDAVAGRILDEAAADLAELVAAVADKLELAAKSFPLALAGGVLVGSSLLREKLKRQLESLGVVPESLRTVPEPVWGAVLLGEDTASNAGS